MNIFNDFEQNEEKEGNSTRFEVYLVNRMRISFFVTQGHWMASKILDIDK